MKAAVILPSLLLLAACHATEKLGQAQETPEACAARFPGLNNNNGLPGATPIYTFDVSRVKGTDRVALQQHAKVGSNMMVTTAGGETRMKFEGDSVAKASEAVARGCAMETDGARLVGIAVKPAHLPIQGS